MAALRLSTIAPMTMMDMLLMSPMMESQPTLMPLLLPTPWLSLPTRAEKSDRKFRTYDTQQRRLTTSDIRRKFNS